MKKLTLLTIAAAFHVVTYCQTGPGGVGTSSSNIIWLDANELALTDGSTVSSFADMSGNTNTFTQATSTKRPIYHSAVFNGLPAIQFDGVNDLLKSGPIVALESSNITYFIVFQRANLTNQILITAAYASSANKWRTYCNSSTNTLLAAQYSPSINYVSYVDAGTPTFLSNHITPTKIMLYQQGVLKQSKNATYTTPTGHQAVGIGNTTSTGSPNNYTLNGYIAEVVVYNSALSNLQRVIVENYLGAKYGMSVPSDFFSFQATHNIGLIALGNDGVNSQTSAQGAGVLEISSPSNLGANEYLMLAHTNVDLLDFTTSDIPASISTHSRWTRTWRVDETGSVGTTNIVFHLAGGNNFANTTSYRLLIDSDGDFSNATVLTGTYNAGAETITFNADLNAGDYITLAGKIEILEIHSITSGPWSNPNTWDCTCVPSQYDDVYIDPFNQVTVDADAEAGYFSVEPNGELIMDADFTLDIYKDWDMVGTVTLTDGEIAFVGSVDQYLDAGGNTMTINDMTINKSGTLTLYEADYILNGTLDPKAGALVLDPTPGNSFTVNSTTTGTEGRIGQIQGGFTISGDFTVKRFIPAGVADWREVCAPVIGATFADWDADLAISGAGFPDGCAYDSQGNCFSSITYTSNGIQNKVIDVSDPIVNGRGYDVYMGDNLSTFSGVTMSTKGTLNNGNDLVKSYNTGWQTIGNPYASPILFSSTTRTSQISNYFYVYDATIGDYQWWDGSSGLGSISELDAGRMNTGQAVWVLVSSLGSITYQQTNKVATGTYIRSAEAIDNSLSLTLKELSSTYSCSVSFSEIDGATDQADTLFDMADLTTGLEAGPKCTIFGEDEKQLKKNYIQPDGKNKSFELFIDIKNPGYYEFSVSNFEAFESYNSILLFDRAINDFVDLKEENYTFYADAGSETERFYIVFTNAATSGDESLESLTLNEPASESLEIIQMGNAFNIVYSGESSTTAMISFTNVLGQTVSYRETVNLAPGNNLITAPGAVKGVHILSITMGDQLITKKVVL